MTTKWDDGDSLEQFINNNINDTRGFGNKKIFANGGKVTICEMVRRTVDTLVLSGMREEDSETFQELLQRLKYVYICAKKMQNRIVKLGGQSEDLFEKIDADYDLQKRISRIEKLK